MELVAAAEHPFLLGGGGAAHSTGGAERVPRCRRAPPDPARDDAHREGPRSTRPIRSPSASSVARGRRPRPKSRGTPTSCSRSERGSVTITQATGGTGRSTTSPARRSSRSISTLPRSGATTPSRSESPATRRCSSRSSWPGSTRRGSSRAGVAGPSRHGCVGCLARGDPPDCSPPRALPCIRARLCHEIGEALAAVDGRIFVDIGDVTQYAEPYMTIRGPGRWHINPGMAEMGWASSGVLGAVAADPKRPALCLRRRRCVQHDLAGACDRRRVRPAGRLGDPRQLRVRDRAEGLDPGSSIVSIPGLGSPARTPASRTTRTT